MHQDMFPAMARNFMTSRHYAANHVRVTLCHAPKNEERGGCAGPVEKGQQSIGVTLNARRQIIPIVPGNAAGECLDLVIILDVDCH